MVAAAALAAGEGNPAEEGYPSKAAEATGSGQTMRAAKVRGKTVQRWAVRARAAGGWGTGMAQWQEPGQGPVLLLRQPPLLLLRRLPPLLRPLHLLPQSLQRQPSPSPMRLRMLRLERLPVLT